MAGIDKTYARNYRDYLSLRGWIYSKKKKFRMRGRIFRLSNFLYEDLRKEWFSGERNVAVMSTPQKVDAWLYRHCPFQFVTDTIIDAYNLHNLSEKDRLRKLDGK